MGDEDTHPMKKQTFRVIRTVSQFFATAALAHTFV
jgi:hypothetical protein